MKLFSIQEVANLLGVSTKTLRRWEEKGILLSQRTPGNQRRYTQDHIDNFRRQSGTFVESTVEEIPFKSPTELISSVPHQKPLDVTGHSQYWTEELVKSISVFKKLAVSAVFVMLFVAVAATAVAALKSANLLNIASLPKVLSIVGINKNKPQPPELSEVLRTGDKAVLGAGTSASNLIFGVNVASEFADSAQFLDTIKVAGVATLSGGVITENQDVNAGAGKLTASNVLYGAIGGTGITVGPGQTPTISSTAVLSLTAGSGISVGTGTKPTISNTGVLSLGGSTGDLTLKAGTGISVSGLTITNSDTGTSQNIFKTIAVTGSTSFAASGNTDTLTFEAGTGITLATNTSSKKVTITGAGGWQENNGALSPANITDDLLLGGISTSTAKFAFINVVGAGTPTASLSAGTAGGAYLNAAGTLATTAKQSLTLGDTNTGSIILSNLTHANAGLTVPSGQSLTFAGITGNNRALYADTTTGVATGVTATSTSLQCLMSGASAPSWGNCPGSGSGGSKWTELNGLLYPNNLTVDLLVGGTTSSSAKFAVLNINSGTPTASVSAGTNGGTYLTATGTLQTTANQLLTIGGVTTGNITLSPLNGSGTVTNTGNLNLLNGKEYQIAGSSVLTASTLGSGVTASSLTSVGTIGAGVWQGTAVGVLYGGTGQTTYTDGQLLIGNTTGNTLTKSTLTAGTGISITNGSGSITIANSQGSIDSFWNQSSGLLFANNSTVDFALGGQASSSAKFAVLNISSGTPTASLSAATAGGASLTAAGVLATTAKQSLTLGDTNTGEIVLSPGGTTALTGRGANLIGAGTLTGLTGLTSSGTITFSGLNANNNVVYATVTTGVLAGASTNTSNLCLLSGAAAPAWGTCDTSLGSNLWNQSLGTIYPNNSTLDLLVGGTTSSSAKFAVLNINSGTPTASLSAGTAGGSYLSAAGTLQTTANQTLTLGGATTGNILVNPRNGTAGGFIAPVTDNVTDLGLSNFNFRNAYVTTYNSGASVGQSLTNSSCVNTTGGIVTGAGSCAATTNFWNQASGLLYAGNTTVDLAIGGTSTSSALFAITGVNNGTPIATLSASTNNNGLALSASSATIQSLRNNTLTIGGATTGNIILSPNNGTAGLTTNNGNFNLSTGNAYQIAGASVLTGLTLGDAVTQSSLTKVGTISTGTWTASAIGLAYGGTNANLTAAAGGIVYSGASALAISAAGSTNQCLLSGGTGAPTWGTCDTSLGSNLWNQALGTIYPNNSTLDLLVGGTTSSSAKFAVLNINSGTPTASVSAGTAGGAYLSASGTLATTAKQTLTIGDTSSGELILQSRGTTVFKNPTAGANQSLFIGEGAGASITTAGLASVGVGYQALNANTSGGNNTAVGYQALLSNITGSSNTAVGYLALDLNTAGSFNTALGTQALVFTTGSSNTAVGYGALYSNSSGGFNTALGYQAGYANNGSYANTTGRNNTFIGYNSGPFSSTQRNNMTAIGVFALVDQADSLVLGGTAFYAVNVGIGTATPSAVLDIQGGNRGANAALIVNQTGASTNDLFTASASGTTRLTITKKGFIDIIDGTSSTAVGYQSLNSSTGTQNTAVGYQALLSNTTGVQNTAVGYQALFSNTTSGNLNTALGNQALRSNTSGTNNTAVGYSALFSNTTGQLNTAVGYQALYTNTGSNNTALGWRALYGNTTGANNTALGYSALDTNTSGDLNTAVGLQALYGNTTGANNTALGWRALYGNTTGANNTALGYSAGSSTIDTYNTFLGYNAESGGTNWLTNATAIGSYATVTCPNCLVLGSIEGINAATASASIGIGTANPLGVLDIQGGTWGGNAALIVNQTGASTNDLFTASASGTTKFTIQNGGTASSAGNFIFDSVATIQTTKNQTLTIGGDTTGELILKQSNLNLLRAPGGAGTGNIFVGLQAGSNGAAKFQTAVGYQALSNTTSGGSNTAVGYQALFSSTVRSSQTAVGYQALYSNVGGQLNTAVGYQALYSNVSGLNSTALGYQALNASTGGNNTAVGASALVLNTTAISNTAVGTSALGSNTTGGNNTAVGTSALGSNTTGGNNTALGYLAGYTSAAGNANTIGTYNTFLGYAAGPGIASAGWLTNATAIGSYATVTCPNCLVLGSIEGINAATASASIGIGTASPLGVLDIQGGSMGGNAALIINQTGASANHILTASASGATRLVLTNTGSLNLGTGIASVSSTFNLNVMNSSISTAAAQIWNTFPNGGQGTPQGCADSFCHTALSLRLGTDSSAGRPGAKDRFINFAVGNSEIIGKVRGNGSGGITYDTTGGDYAEWFQKEVPDEQFDYGDVVCLNVKGKVVKCDNNNTKILGAVTDTPGFVGNSGNDDDPSYILVGLLGQIRIKVSLENGSIVGGDMISYSSQAGVGAKAVHKGFALARAIESFEASGSARILAYVNSTWYDPSVYLASNGTLANTSPLSTEAAALALGLSGVPSIPNNTPSAGSASNAASQSGSFDLASDANFIDLKNRVASVEAKAAFDATQIEDLRSMIINSSTQSAFLASISSEPQVLGASTSADFISNLQNLDIASATISGNLMVLGRTTLADLGVTGNIAAGLLSIHGLDSALNNGNGGASINSVGDLNLQSNGLGGINILAGKVTIDTKGNINSQGEITVKKINIDTTAPSGTSLGSGTLLAGDTGVTISTTAVTGRSRILVTPTTKTGNQVLVVSNKSAGNGFTISIEQPYNRDIKFDWWIVDEK